MFKVRLLKIASLASLYLSTIFIVFNVKFFVYFILLFFILQLLQKRGLGQSYFTITKLNEYKYLVLFFVLHSIGLLYTQNIQNGFDKIETKLSFLLLPVVFAVSSIQTKVKNNIIILFAFASLLGAIISIGNALYHDLFYNNSYYLRYDSLTEIIDVHPVYLSMFLAFSSLQILYQVITKGRKTNLLLLFILLFCCLLFLSSRTPIISFTLIVIYILIKFKNKLRSKFLILGVLSVSVLLCLFLVSGHILDRLQQSLAYELKYQQWLSALEVLQKNPLWGVGTGDCNDELFEVYIKNDFNIPYKFKHNPHNQYLQTAVELGFFGILVLSLLYFRHLKIFNPVSNTKFQIFLLLFIFLSFTESLLNRIHGVLFFCFFYILLIGNNDKHE